MIGNYMKVQAERNNIWDKSQLRTCFGVLGTENRIMIANTIMDQVKNQQRNLALALHDYQKAYDIVRHNWMTSVYQWMRVPEKVVMVIIKLIEWWKTRLEVTKGERVLASRTITGVKVSCKKTAIPR